MRKPAPRLLISGTGSGCGKTTVTCAVLSALKNRGYDVASFKCGPDYIDPMFHSEVVGTRGTNIDLFFLDAEGVKSLFLKHAGDLNVIEGVMGYYDGVAFDNAEASGHHMAQALETPAVLVVNGYGMALSAAAVVRGFVELRKPSGIKGVIFNHISSGVYPLLKSAVEAECGIAVFGYLPDCPECALESRHLGLITAQEVKGLEQKLALLAAQAEKTIDLDGLIELMRAQAVLEAPERLVKRLGSVRIAVARDEAFCFYYRDNLKLLEELGATLVPFSPIRDGGLPDCDGLLLGGGYPELHAREISGNRSMLESIRRAVTGGLPTVAECGGFMLLTGQIGAYSMAGVIRTACHDRQRLTRFGYAELTASQDSLLFNKGDRIRGHEFHHWDAEAPGEALTARKPSGRAWKCAWVSDTLYAGYPHLYFCSNPHAAERFVLKCMERKMRRGADGN